MGNWLKSAGAARFQKTVSLNPASVAAATAGAVQTFTVNGLLANKFTFAQFESTPATATVYLAGPAACYTANTLTLVFGNNDPSNAVDLAAANFIIWQP